MIGSPTALFILVFCLGWFLAVFFAGLYFRTRIKASTHLAMIALWLYDIEHLMGERWGIIRDLLQHIELLIQDKPHRTLDELYAYLKERHPIETSTPLDADGAGRLRSTPGSLGSSSEGQGEVSGQSIQPGTDE